MKVLFVLFAAIVVWFFFWTYGSLFFTFYEESKAYFYADIIFIPIISCVFFFVLITGLYTSIKRRENNWKGFCTEVVQFVAVFGIGYMIFIRPVVSGLILFLNTVIGGQQPILISGLILERVQQRGRGAQYEMVIDDEVNGELTLDTTYHVIQSYAVGDHFEANLIKGGLGLIYK